MATLIFPAEQFEIKGDAGAIREAAGSYGRFGTTAGDAARTMRGLNSTDWVGTEGDMFRDKVKDIPPHLDTATSAFGEVARALHRFADAVDTAQGKMRSVRADAEQTFASLRGVRRSREGLREPNDDQVKADPSARTAYDDTKRQLDDRIAGLEHSWRNQLNAAGALRNDVHAAAGAAANAIRAAGRSSPTADQNWLERKLEQAGNWIDTTFAGVRNWIKEHADVFRFLAKTLKIVGAVLMAGAAVLAVIAAFVPVAGWLAELPLAGIFEAGSILYGAGDILDTATDWAEGKISGKDLIVNALISAGLSAVGFAAAKPLIKGIEKVGPKVKKWFNDIFGKKNEPPPRKGCFVAGTSICAPAGRRPIEAISVGDVVSAVNPESGELQDCLVTATIVHTVMTVLDIEVAAERITCSPEHVFWIEAGGWTKAADLVHGDRLVDIRDSAWAVGSIARREGEFTVHNIEVSGLHSYHVSELGILVHNKPWSAPEPVGEPKKRSANWLKNKGVDPHEIKDVLGDNVSHYDIYVDRNGNMFAVPKGGNPKDGEYLGNVDDYGDGE